MIKARRAWYNETSVYLLPDDVKQVPSMRCLSDTARDRLHASDHCGATKTKLSRFLLASRFYVVRGSHKSGLWFTSQFLYSFGYTVAPALDQCDSGRKQTPPRPELEKQGRKLEISPRRLVTTNFAVSCTCVTAAASRVTRRDASLDVHLDRACSTRLLLSLEISESVSRSKQPGSILVKEKLVFVDPGKPHRRMGR